jgi:RNA 2',3'-cyclic 3'-phosphodiesterase
MRLFVGLSIPEEIVASVAATIELLSPAAPKLRWSPNENLHITTKFLGECPEATLDQLQASLRQIRAEPIQVHLAGFGWFPNPHSPRVFWVAARGGEPLNQLAAKTDEASSDLGFAREAKPFTPHVTLARVSAGTDLRDLRGVVAGIENPDWGRFRAEEFFLYLSEPGPAGSVYTKLAGFPLTD